MNYQILCERNSPSDDEIVCVSVLKKNGELVQAGEVLYELEGAKAIFEVESPANGYFIALVKEGERLQIGQVIGEIRDEIAQNLTPQHSPNRNKSNDNEPLATIPFTKPAQLLFANLEQNLKSLVLEKLDGLKTYSSDELQKIISDLTIKNQNDFNLNAEAWSQQLERFKGKTKLALIGGGFGALQVLDLILQESKYEVVGFFSDEEKNLLEQLKIPKLGNCTEEEISKFRDNYPEIGFVISVGISPSFRLKMLILLQKLGTKLPTLLDHTVRVSRNASIGESNVIFANCIVGLDTQIGDGNFISSNSVIEHHNIIGDANCFGPSLSTSGVVTIGTACRFGAGVIVEPRLKIGDRVIVASNTSVTQSLADDSVSKNRK